MFHLHLYWQIYWYLKNATLNQQLNNLCYNSFKRKESRWWFWSNKSEPLNYLLAAPCFIQTYTISKKKKKKKKKSAPLWWFPRIWPLSGTPRSRQWRQTGESVAAPSRGDRAPPPCHPRWPPGSSTRHAPLNRPCHCCCCCWCCCCCCQPSPAGWGGCSCGGRCGRRRLLHPASAPVPSVVCGRTGMCGVISCTGGGWSVFVYLLVRKLVSFPATKYKSRTDLIRQLCTLQLPPWDKRLLMKLGQPLSSPYKVYWY